MITKTTQPVYTFIAIIIIFFNSLLLPQGLLYTTLLTPFFIYWLLKEGQVKRISCWMLFLLLPVPFHLAKSIEIKSYLVSTINVFTLLIFTFTVVHALKKLGPSLRNIFTTSVIINCLLIGLAFFALMIPSLKEIIWNQLPISPGVEPFPRLQMFAYEPSHYALLFSPIAIFFILRIILGLSRAPLITGLAIILPLLASLSFGVVAGIAASLLFCLGFYFSVLPRTTSRFISYSVFMGLIVTVVAFISWPENPIFHRIQNILFGTDTSTKGRISDSFYFASALLKNHGAIFGIGPGQIKILGHDLIMEHYRYWYSALYANATMRIPNSMAELLATYGIYGFIIKLTLQMALFYLTRVYANLYSLSLFLFIFTYQFTGSFMTSTAELAIWAITFMTRFPEYDFKNMAELKRVQ